MKTTGIALSLSVFDPCSIRGFVLWFLPFSSVYRGLSFSLLFPSMITLLRSEREGRHGATQPAPLWRDRSTGRIGDLARVGASGPHRRTGSPGRRQSGSPAHDPGGARLL